MDQPMEWMDMGDGEGRERRGEGRRKGGVGGREGVKLEGRERRGGVKEEGL